MQDPEARTSTSPGDPAPWVRQLRALAVLMGGAVIFVLGTPGLDFAGFGEYRTESQRAQAHAQLGPVWGPVAVGLMDLNRALRRPLYDAVADVQPAFRIRQSWHLYRNGPGEVRRVQILVDGREVYLTGSAEADWNEAVFRYRRVRPPMETTAKEHKATNTWGMVRWIVTEARGDWPEAEEIVVRSLSGPWPGRELDEKHRWEARAPEWTVRRR